MNPKLEAEVARLINIHGPHAVEAAVRWEIKRQQDMRDAFCAARRGDESKMKEYNKRYNGRI